MPPKRKRATPTAAPASGDRSTPPKRLEPPKEPFVPTLGSGEYVSLYEGARAWAEKSTLFQRVVDEENGYRELFAQDRDSDFLADDHVLLVPAHDDQGAPLPVFSRVTEGPEQAALPRVFDNQGSTDATAPPPVEPGASTVASLPTFRRNLDLFTEAQLRFMEWDNVMVAGGAALAALQPVPDKYNENNTTRREYFHRVAYSTADVDLFVYGLETEAEANAKLEQIFFAITEALPVKALCFRSQHAVTIISEYPYRHIQVVLRLYKSPAEVLMGFDVDACSVGYDGNRVWMTPRAHRALTHGYNLVDMERRSPSYEMRLAKYAGRGFQVVVPTLDRSRIDPQLFERRFDQLQGLARLLLLEKLKTPEARHRYKELLRLKKLRPTRVERGGFISRMSGMDQERMAGSASASDYSTVYLPWAPGWTAERCRKTMYTKDMILNSPYYDPNKKHHTHPCFFGTAAEILKDCCGACPPVAPQDVDPDSPYVSGALTWVTVNPGAQGKIGSFHPITEGDWTEGAYLDASTEDLVTAVNADDLTAAKAALRLGADVNGRDSVGRTPLHVAAYANATRCAQLLLDEGAKVAARTPEGRTAMHVAAMYGHEAIIAQLLARGKELEAAGAMEEGNDGDDDDEEEEEEEEDEEEDFTSIRAIVEQRRKAELAALKAEDPDLDGPKQDQLDLDAKDWDAKMTPLQYAVFFGHSAAVDTLLAAGGDVSTILTYSSPDNMSTTRTYTMLMLALLGNHPETMRLLLKRGAPINQLDVGGETVLHKAVRQRNLSMVRLLVAWKAPSGAEALDVDKVSQAAKTPLLLAIEGGVPATAVDPFDWPVVEAAEDVLAEKLARAAQTTPSQAHTGRGAKRARRSAGATAGSGGDDDALVDGFDDTSFAIVQCLVEQGGATTVYDESHVPASHGVAKRGFGFGGFGGRRKASNTTGAESTPNSKVRAALNQPLNTALCRESPRLVDFLLSHGAAVNWVARDNCTPTDSNDASLAAVNQALKSAQVLDEVKAVTRQMERLKPDSWSYFVLHCYRRQQAGNQAFSDHAAAQRAAIRLARHRLSLRKAMAKALRAAGGKKFIALRLGKDDADLKEAQKQAKQGARLQAARQAEADRKAEADAASDVIFQYESLPEDIPGTHMRAQDYEDKDHARYHKLFEAVWAGSAARIERLTRGAKIGAQAHVCSRSKLTGMTPLHVALHRNHADIVPLLLDIAKEQFTPLAMLKSDDTQAKDSAPALNNYELAQLMRSYRPGTLLDRKGGSMHQQGATIDPNADVTLLNCVTSPATLFAAVVKQPNQYYYYGSREQPGVTLAHVAANVDAADALGAGLQWAHAHALAPPVYAGVTDDAAGGGALAGADTVPWLLRQLCRNDPTRLTPFELALARGSLATARIVLAEGAVRLPAKLTADQYKGLDVGGRKMDWAMDHVDQGTDAYDARRAKKANRLRGAWALAATYDRADSLRYLADEAHGVWAAHERRKGHEDFPYFEPTCADTNGRLAVHHAAAARSLEAMQVLLRLHPEHVDVADDSGVTPLHIACTTSGWQPEGEPGVPPIVTLLLKHGADPTKRSTTLGWNALHYAASQARGADLVDTLLALPAVTGDVVNAKSAKFGQSPLVVAAYLGHTHVVQRLTGAASCNVLARDASGDMAIHHAIKQQHTAVVRHLLSLPLAGSAIKENGVGLSPLDACMLRMVQDVANEQQRWGAPAGGSFVSVTHLRNRARLEESPAVGHKRDIVSNDDRRELTNILLSQVGAGELILTEMQTCEAFGSSVATLPAIMGVDDGDDDDDDDAMVDVDDEVASSSEEEADDDDDDDDDDGDGDAPTSLNGCVVCLTGTLSKPRADLIKLINGNGGTYAATMKKAVTHLVCADPNSGTVKLQKARDAGVKVVGESFLRNLS